MRCCGQQMTHDSDELFADFMQIEYICEKCGQRITQILWEDDAPADHRWRMVDFDDKDFLASTLDDFEDEVKEAWKSEFERIENDSFQEGIGYAKHGREV